MAGMLLAACGRSETTASTAPGGGGPRIVCTVPAATLNLVRIGAVDSLVGVSKFDTIFLPEAKQNLPVVGDYGSLNYERLVELKPSVVVIQTAEPRIPARLKDLAAQQHFEIINVKLENTSDLWDMVQTLGKISGHASDAETAVAGAKQELANIAEQYKDQKHPRVVYVISDSLMIVGGETILNEMLMMAGGTNAGAEVGNGFPTISMETLVKLNPDVLLIGKPDEPPQRKGMSDPRLDNWMRLDVPAVRNKHVYLVTDGDIHMASVQLPRHVRMLAELIHK